MDNQLQSLDTIKGYLSERSYQSAAASIIASYYKSLYADRGKKAKRTMVFDQTNLKLRSLGIKEISYDFLRKIG